jgi:translation initiation factor IF-3
MAREAGLDLVEVAPTARPPVCRIMDYGKWRYQQQKKEDKSRANSRGGRLKQLNIDTVRIGDHDLLIKMNHAREFLKEGNKVQFTLRFKGREMAHLDLGRLLMNKVKAELFLVSKVERDAKMEGRRMTLVLQPDHKNPAAIAKAQAQQAAVNVRQGAMTAGATLNIPQRPAGVSASPPAPGVTPARPAAAAPAPAPSAPRPVPQPVT